MKRILLLLSLFSLALMAIVVILESSSGQSARAESGAKFVRVTDGMFLDESNEIGFHRPEGKIFAGARLTRPMALLLRTAALSGWRGKVNGPVSGARTHSEQADLHRRFLRGKGAPAFRPGTRSRHETRNVRLLGGWSQAIDVSRPGELLQVASEFGVGLSQPYSDEPWHIEAEGPFSLPSRFSTVLTSGVSVPASGSIWPTILLAAAALFLLPLTPSKPPQLRSMFILLLLGLTLLLLPSTVFAVLFLLLLLLVGSFLVRPWRPRPRRRGLWYGQYLQNSSSVAQQEEEDLWLDDLSWRWPGRSRS